MFCCCLLLQKCHHAFCGSAGSQHASWRPEPSCTHQQSDKGPLEWVRLVQRWDWTRWEGENRERMDGCMRPGRFLFPGLSSPLPFSLLHNPCLLFSLGIFPMLCSTFPLFHFCQYTLLGRVSSFLLPSNCWHSESRYVSHSEHCITILFFIPLPNRFLLCLHITHVWETAQ